jgi:anti-anti-sigma factor
MTAQPQQGRPVLHLVVSTELLTVTHRDQGPIWVMTLVGEADLSTRDELVWGLRHALSQGRGALVVDVSQLEFCDSSCATELIEANCNAPGTEMVLTGSHGMVSRVFDLLDPLRTLARHQ